MRDPTRDTRLRVEGGGTEVRSRRDARFAGVGIGPGPTPPRLLRVDIHGRTTDVPDADSFEQILGIVKETPGKIKEKTRTRLRTIGRQLREVRLGQEPLVALPGYDFLRAHVDAHHVRCPEECVDALAGLPTHLAPDLPGHLARVVERDPHPKRLGRARGRPTDVPETENSEDATLHLEALVLRLVETAGARVVVGLVESP